MPPKKKPESVQDDQNLSSSSNQEIETTNGSNTQSSEPRKKKRKKVVIACIYCRRSHMICDDQRPCSRCIKRNIGHLCHDEPVSQNQKKKLESRSSVSTPNPAMRTVNEEAITAPLNPLDVQSVPAHLQAQLSFDDKSQVQQPNTGVSTNTNNNHSIENDDGIQNIQQSSIPQNKSLYSMDPLFNFNQQPFFFSEHAGSEFSSLNEFLSMLDDPDLLDNNVSNTGNNAGSLFDNNQSFSNNNNGNNLHNQQTQDLQQQNEHNQTNQSQQVPSNPITTSHSLTNLSLANFSGFNSPNLSGSNSRFNSNILLPHLASQQTSQQPHHLISDSARDKFFLTAADPSTEISPEERLKQVINAKLEAGLLQPYNYAKGYARLQSYMDNYMNQSSKQRILKPLSIFRPAFRAIARTLKDVDLILVEENFERMLLDYDRVFTSMAIPACLWRRTGEIYRGNKEFASLVEVSADDLRDGKLAIYELMSEESAVNFWEKYGAIAFDKGQKAVLTSCNLRTKDGRRRKTCCFSFTIRRDRYNIPSCIVGNFIPINP